MKNLLIGLLLIIVAPFALADSWMPPEPQTVSSPKGESLLRAIPPERLDKAGEWSKMIFIVYRLDQATQAYRETSRFDVEGHPLDLFINDAGDRIVTMDQYFGIGMGPRVVGIYDSSGQELKKWALKDFYDREKLEKLPETTASVHWHGPAMWIENQKKIFVTKAGRSGDGKSDFDDYLVDVFQLTISKRVDKE